MNRNSFLLIAVALVCGTFGYYIGNNNKNVSNTETVSANLSVYDGPFGLDMGLSLDDVKKVCRIEHIENDAYEVTPPKKNDLFETYIVWIDAEYGVHGVRAISEKIFANDNGTELKLRFENIVESIENKYGKYERTDKNSDNLFDEPQYFMHTLHEGSRELSAVWAKEHQSQLPDDIVGIYVEVAAAKEMIIPEDAGYVILEYGFSNSDAVKSKADSVF